MCLTETFHQDFFFLLNEWACPCTVRPDRPGMAQWLVRAERAIAERGMLTCSVLGRCGPAANAQRHPCRSSFDSAPGQVQAPDSQGPRELPKKPADWLVPSLLDLLPPSGPPWATWHLLPRQAGVPISITLDDQSRPARFRMQSRRSMVFPWEEACVRSGLQLKSSQSCSAPF